MFFKIFQTVCDLFIVLIISPIWLTAMLVISTIVFFIDGLPVFFLQQRVGLNMRIFKIYKFRTMSVNMLPNELDRITKVGAFLRRASLDELPQIINIIRRDMSLVGPRPIPKSIADLHDPLIIQQRSQVLPGLSGYAQIKYAGKPRKLHEKFELDIKYINKLSSLLYLKILFLTIKVIIVRYQHNRNGGSL